MAGLSPNSANIARTQRAIQGFSHLVIHPEYEYWRSEWTKIRDALAGEREIKRKGAVYLRPMPGTDKNDKDGRYAEYLYRAVFYNMSAQTLAGMVGQVFRRPPVIRHLPIKFENAVKRFAKDGTSHQGFAKTVASEQIAIGRFGVLVDVASQVQQASPQSYAVGYAAENILDWTIEDVDGFYQPTRVLLREFVREDGLGNQPEPAPTKRGQRARKQTQMVRLADGSMVPASGPVRQSIQSTGGYTYITVYRELLLDRGADGSRVYRQRVYREDPTGIPWEEFTPNIRGNTIPFIPFVFFGSQSNAGDCEKPPLLDIVNLNLAHYRTYAELEYGRFYTALPTYYAPGNDDNDASEYHIGPGMVWQVPEGQAPGILEFKGEGLKTLERALNEKEAQIAAIGGRLMPGMSKSVSESDNQSQMREANEQSLLLNVIMALEEGMALVVRYWLMFRDVPLRETASLRYEIDTTFLSTALDARALRAIQQLYEGGLLPIDDLYENFQRNGIISSTTTLEEFKAKMEDPKSYIGQPDAIAMRNGYANRSQELEQSRVAREADFEQQDIDLERRRVELDEEKLAIASKVGSTSVAASRKLGDPEGAAPSKAEQAQVSAQRAATAASSAAAAARPKPAGT